MDIELSTHGLITAASGNTISLLSAMDLSVRTTINLPDKMHFKEEGGASLHPDGSSYI